MRPQTIVLLFDYAVRSTLVLGLAGLAVQLLRRRSAAVRHLVWLAALACLLLLPLARRWTPQWNTPAQTLIGAPLRTVITVSAGLTPKRLPSDDALRWIWLAGFAAALARVVLSQWSAARLVRRSAAFIGNCRISPDTVIPLVCGLRRPVIVLPESARGWTRNKLSSVLAHEQSHVARRDTLTQVLAQLACALYWPQPLVWLAAAELRKECEQAADDGVLVNGTKASAYAGHLIEIARGLTPGSARFEGGIAMARTTQLERRIAALLHPTRDRRDAGRGFAALLTGLAVVLLVMLAAVRTPLLAQQGRLTGIVRDASGAVVPKARVDIRSTPANVEPKLREIVYTDETGGFALENVPDGGYDITVSKAGFARFEQLGVLYNSAKTRPLDFTLNLGMIQERVQVQGQRQGASPQSAAPGPPQRINVGGNVQQANLISKPNPSYPVECKAEGIEGTVVFKAVIGKDGAILSLQQVNKLVDARLVQSARDAVQQWRYRPTLLNGDPVEVATEIEVNYTLAR